MLMYGSSYLVDTIDIDTVGVRITIMALIRTSKLLILKSIHRVNH